MLTETAGGLGRSCKLSVRESENWRLRLWGSKATHQHHGQQISQGPELRAVSAGGWASLLVERKTFHFPMEETKILVLENTVCYLDMMAHACNLNIKEAGVGGLP